MTNKLKRKKIDLQNQIIAKKTALMSKMESSEEKEQLKTEITKAKLARGEITTAQAEAEAAQIEAEATKEESTLKQEIAEAELELKNTEMELTSLGQTNASTWSTIGSTVSMVAGGLGTLISGSSTWLAIMTAVGFAFKIIPPIIKTIQTINKMRLAEETAGETKKSFIQMAGAATGLGVPGLIIAAALMALAGIAGIAALLGGISKQKESSAEKVNNLSNEIYKLQEKANAINQITTSFDDLDNKILRFAIPHNLGSFIALTVLHKQISS